jgi:hypothetical protein
MKQINRKKFVEAIMLQTNQLKYNCIKNDFFCIEDKNDHTEKITFMYIEFIPQTKKTFYTIKMFGINNNKLDDNTIEYAQEYLQALKLDRTIRLESENGVKVVI